MSSLAELGDWPSIEIGSHSVIRHAYENVLNACARLASFATGGPTTTDGPISQQQEILAVDDLVAFAIHARRLIENTASQSRFRHVTVRQGQKQQERDISITRIINILVHHKDIRIIRCVLELELSQRKVSIQEFININDHLFKNGDNKYFSPLVYLESDRGTKISFEVKEMIETFQVKVLNPIIELCDENKLFLDDDLFRA
jgi:hypothetical protein